MTRMLFLDIDGTLVGKDQRIPQSAIRAIRAAQGNGHLVLICTGRARAGAAGWRYARRPGAWQQGGGLRFAAATMGVPLADTVAIGDSDNDLTMIEVAGIGIAMGNGEQCAKDAADWVADAVDTSASRTPSSG